MGIASLISYKPHKYRCDFCHKPAEQLYRVNFETDGQFYSLHPGNCIAQAQANFNEKKENGIVPTINRDETDDLDEIENFSREDNIDRE